MRGGLVRGPIRQMIDSMQIWAEASGLTLEQVADVFDKVNRINKGTTDDHQATLATMQPAKGKH